MKFLEPPPDRVEWRDCARPPSDTTGRAVFRIRRLNSAAGCCRKIWWHYKTPELRDRVRQGLVQAPCSGGAPRSPTALGHLQQATCWSQSTQLSLAPLLAMPPQPEAFPDVPPDPSLQPENCGSILGSW